MEYRFDRIRILVIGDVMLDQYVWGDVKRISPEAPIPVLHVRRKTHVLGGAGNVANNLVGLGAAVSLLGIRGDDLRGERLARLLDTHGISDRLLVVNDRPTITKQRVMSQNQQLLRLDEEERLPLSETMEESLVKEVLTDVNRCDAVILSDYGKGCLTPKLCQAAIGACRKKGIPVLVDPKGTDWERYRGASCLTPNEREFASFIRLGESADPDVLCRNAHTARKSLALDHLLITQGPSGMMLAGGDGEDCFRIAAQAREVYDVSGAGDTVIATLAAVVASGRNWKEAAEAANLAAGIAVGKVGTQPVFLDELNRILGGVGEHSPKICSRKEALRRIVHWKEMGQRIVFANGCFDLLHAGHVNLLHAAAREGNRLVVALNSDSSVKRLKGPARPILDQNDRANIVAALECVDLVTLFDDDTPLDLINLFMPDVLVKGGDYRREQVVGHEEVEGWGGKVVLIPLTQGKSTTGVVDRIAEASKTKGIP